MWRAEYDKTRGYILLLVVYKSISDVYIIAVPWQKEFVACYSISMAIFCIFFVFQIIVVIGRSKMKSEFS